MRDGEAVIGGPTGADRLMRMVGWLGALWGVAGVAFLLGYAIYRLTPIAVAAFDHPLAWNHWGSLIANLVFLAYYEGYKGFQRAFSPRVAARCRHLRDQPTFVNVLLAPFFVIGYFRTTRRRAIGVYALTAIIVLFVVLVHELRQPWRGLLDAGVVVGLAWGLVATLAFCWQALTQPEFTHSPELE